MALTPREPGVVLNPWTIIGEYYAGDQILKLYAGLVTTIRNVELEILDRNVLRRYKDVSGDDRSAVNFSYAKLVVLCDVQIAWYEQQGNDVPPRVTSAMETTMAKAKQAKAEAEGGETAGKTKAPRVTIKSIIEQGLLAGKSADDILAEVHQHKPEAKADATHVAYYRHFLEKDGKLEKQPRVKKEKAPKPEAPTSAKLAVAAGGKAGAARPKPGREAKSTAKARA